MGGDCKACQQLWPVRATPITHTTREHAEALPIPHISNVVHRDLKLENLLLATPDDITKVRHVSAWFCRLIN